MSTLSVHNYAQTNIQLYNQLRAGKYSDADILAVRRAYDLTLHYLPGRFRPSGKPLQDHLVGTASILAREQASRRLLIAGLLHAIYAHGDFGIVANWNWETQRKQLQRELDQETETLIAAYHKFPWTPSAVRRLHADAATLDATQRELVLLRLANTLEDTLDLAVLYCPNHEARLRSLAECNDAMVVLANGLEVPQLAKELEASLAVQQTRFDAVHDRASFVFFTDNNRDWSLPPASCSRKVIDVGKFRLWQLGQRAVRKARRTLKITDS